jgi:hypothetical protein
MMVIATAAETATWEEEEAAAVMEEVTATIMPAPVVPIGGKIKQLLLTKVGLFQKNNFCQQIHLKNEKQKNPRTHRDKTSNLVNLQ